MDVNTKLIDAMTSLSRTVLAFSLIAGAISLYLWQRALFGATFIDLYQGISSPRRNVQIDYLGLRFSYLTMTLLWPVVLGGLCSATRHSVKKLSHTWKCLKARKLGETEDTIACMVPHAFTPRRLGLGNHRLFIQILTFLPPSAVLVHFLVSATLGIQRLVTSWWWEQGGIQLLLSLLCVTLASIIGLLGARQFPHSMREFMDVLDGKGPDDARVEEPKENS